MRRLWEESVRARGTISLRTVSWFGVGTEGDAMGGVNQLLDLDHCHPRRIERATLATLKLAKRGRHRHTIRR
jgi:hypothetical protein